jgi:formamidopyrimidine-DNA glycosylase
LETSEAPRGLGLEPLGEAFDAAALARLFAGRKTPLKAALLDQRLVARLGNIYVCEALCRARLSPRRTAGALALKGGAPSAKADGLAEAIRSVLEEAVAAGGIIQDAEAAATWAWASARIYEPMRCRFCAAYAIRGTSD